MNPRKPILSKFENSFIYISQFESFVPEKKMTKIVP
jgi:hypothetical protein